MKIFSLLIPLLSMYQVIDSFIIQDRSRSSGPMVPLMRWSHPTSITQTETVEYKNSTKSASETPLTKSKHLKITDYELNDVFHKLFKYDYKPLQNYKINLYKKSDELFFTVNPEIFEVPRNKYFCSIYEDYGPLKPKEVLKITEMIVKNQNLLLDTFFDNTTAVLSTAMDFLASKGFLKNDINEYKKCLHNLWYGPVLQSDYYAIAESEADGTFITDVPKGPYNWICAAKMEKQGRLKVPLKKWNTIFKTVYGEKMTLVSFDYMTLDGLYATPQYILVGTSPELDLALYTICFYARPNADCSVYFENVKFTVHVTVNEYSGRNFIDGIDLRAIDDNE